MWTALCVALSGDCDSFNIVIICCKPSGCGSHVIFNLFCFLILLYIRWIFGVVFCAKKRCLSFGILRAYCSSDLRFVCRYDWYTDATWTNEIWIYSESKTASISDHTRKKKNDWQCQCFFFVISPHFATVSLYQTKFLFLFVNVSHAYI